MQKLNIQSIFKKYALLYDDLEKVIDLLRLYSFFDLSLGMELLPLYKYNEVVEVYNKLISNNKDNLIKGVNNGQ